MAKKPGVDLGAYLREKGSPLADHVPQLMKVANRYRVDPRFIVAISGGESSFGKVQHGFNAWGIGPGRSYSDWNEGLEAAAKLLRENYIGKGLRSLTKIGAKWAPVGAGNDPTNLNSNWFRNVSTIYAALGGDINDVTKGWRGDAAPKAVAQAPSQKTVLLGQGAAVAFGVNPGAVRGDELADLTMQNLTRIGRGESPVKLLEELVSTSMRVDEARAAAKVTQRDMQPKTTPSQTNREDKEPQKGSSPEDVKLFQPGGGWKGTYNVALGFKSIAERHGLGVMSEKRARQNTASGHRSDHWEQSKDSYAFDLSNGSSPTPEMDAAAVDIAKRLGWRWKPGDGPLEITKIVNGYRIQILYRTNTGGNHFNHIHAGVRKIGA